jgi:L-alanine-DL-glutamate epimerase-like enolase superfamily enzyme
VSVRIAEVRVHEVSVPLVRRFVTAVRSTGSLEAVIVEVVDSLGRSGWGEAPASWRVTGESVPSIRAAVLGPLATAIVDGAPLDELDALTTAVATSVRGNAAARCAVDSALHDLAAQDAGLPLYRYFGAPSPRVITDMTLSVGDGESLVRDALRHVAEGFTTIKVKVGAGSGDAQNVRAVRAAVGPSVRLRVDANQGWTAQQAVEIIRYWEDEGVGLEFVEQPVRARAIDDLAFVTSRVQTPVLADESVWDSDDLREIVARRAADAINVKLAKSGGPTEARVLARLAAESSMTVLVGSMMESSVGVGVAAAFAASIGEGPHDLDAGLWLASSAIEGGARYAGPELLLPDAVGAGVRGLAASGRVEESR